MQHNIAKQKYAVHFQRKCGTFHVLGMCEDIESKLISRNACYEYHFVQHILL